MNNNKEATKKKNNLISYPMRSDTSEMTISSNRKAIHGSVDKVGEIHYSLFS